MTSPNLPAERDNSRNTSESSIAPANGMLVDIVLPQGYGDRIAGALSLPMETVQRIVFLVHDDVGALRACEGIGGNWTKAAAEWISPFIRAIGGKPILQNCDIVVGIQTCTARRAAINADGLAAMFLLQNQYAWQLRNSGEAGYAVDRAVGLAISSKNAYDKARDYLLTSYKSTLPVLSKTIRSLEKLQGQITGRPWATHTQDICDCMVAIHVSSTTKRLDQVRGWRDALRGVVGNPDERAAEVNRILMEVEDSIIEDTHSSNARMRRMWMTKKMTFMPGRDDPL